jgi:phenylpropionate dioxygenase-like ring-hydroxylating dioxygenase large terminal subunit
LIVLRGRDGKARAFKNACRHRGAELATGAGCAGAFVCPYHGWSYDLDGALIGIPHEEGFPDFDKAENNLIEVTAIEKGGIIYVIQQDPKDDHSEAVTLLDGLPQVLKADQTLFAETTGVVDANWKLHLESFLEGYPIKPAHKTTFFPFGYDNLNVIESSGPHSRVTFPFKRIEALKDAPPNSYEVADKLTYVTHLFPIVLIAELSHHITLGILEPLSVNQTKMTSYHLTRSHDAAGKDAAIAAAKKDLAFVNETGQKEDIALVTGIQKGLQSGANEVFTFGEFEGAIIHFHSEMARRLPPS